MYSDIEEPIANARLGGNERCLRILGGELLTELIDINAQIMCLVRAVGSPNLFEQLTVRENLAGVPNESREQAIFRWREVHFLSGDGHLTADQVHRELAGSKDG